MVFRRQGRPTFYFQARREFGYRLLSTGTKQREMAKKIVAMWDLLAESREWGILDRVREGEGGITVAQLFDLWTKAQRNLARLKFLMNDRPLSEQVDTFITWYAAQGWKPDTVAHVKVHVQKLLTTVPLLSDVSTASLTAALTAYPCSPSTRRKVHADWSSFFGYLTAVPKLFHANPMEDVAKPAAKLPPIQFYETEVAEKIVGYFPDAKRRALFALAYGSSVDVSTMTVILRSDIDPEAQEIRAAGTKTSTRDRVVMVADWAWPTFWTYAKTVHPHAKVFEGFNRWTCSDWHREAVVELKLDVKYPLKNARHHWAVRMLRGGAPIRMVQEQMGHATSQLTLDRYGRFMPSAADRKKWEKTVAKHDARRRKANE
jgi:integrase